METVSRKLKFQKVELNCWPAWVTGFGVGQYKVVQYGKSWYCYIHMPWASNWGNSCFCNKENKSMEYSSRKEAMKAAQKHFEGGAA
jgi:hypothetical protein